MSLIDPVRLLDLLHDAAGRFDVDAVSTVDSTNSEIERRLLNGAGSGTVVVADCQTAGRGRRGRQWLSSPEDSLTFSLAWRFPGPPGRLAGLSLVVGLALARALQALGISEIGLKWPNDVLLRRAGGFAKLAGVLVELSSDRRGCLAIIGIGINLQAPPAADLLQPAAGLAQSAVGQPERHLLLASVLRELARAFDVFAVDGFAALKNDWSACHAWQDEAVSVLEAGVVVQSGSCRGVDDDGALLLETANGIERVYAGDVSLRRS